MTKLLILLGAVLAVVWLFIGRRRGSERPAASSQAAPAKPQAMLACAHCGVHLPQADVLAGTDGRPYCSDAHRAAGPR